MKISILVIMFILLCFFGVNIASASTTHLQDDTTTVDISNMYVSDSNSNSNESNYGSGNEITIYPESLDLQLYEDESKLCTITSSS